MYPECIRYTSDESFLEIDDELIRNSTDPNYIALIGDFNARTTTVSDYIIPDEKLLEI